jgi:hypothetical protein
MSFPKKNMCEEGHARAVWWTVIPMMQVLLDPCDLARSHDSARFGDALLVLGVCWTSAMGSASSDMQRQEISYIWCTYLEKIIKNYKCIHMKVHFMIALSIYISYYTFSILDQSIQLLVWLKLIRMVTWDKNKITQKILINASFIRYIN